MAGTGNGSEKSRRWELLAALAGTAVVVVLALVAGANRIGHLEGRLDALEEGKLAPLEEAKNSGIREIVGKKSTAIDELNTEVRKAKASAVQDISKQTKAGIGKLNKALQDGLKEVKDAKVSAIEEITATLQPFRDDKFVWSSCKDMDIGFNKSHGYDTSDWCPNGYFISQMDMNTGKKEVKKRATPHMSPIIAKVKCCKLTLAQ